MGRAFKSPFWKLCSLNGNRIGLLVCGWLFPSAGGTLNLIIGWDSSQAPLCAPREAVGLGVCFLVFNSWWTFLSLKGCLEIARRVCVDRIHESGSAGIQMGGLCVMEDHPQEGWAALGSCQQQESLAWDTGQDSPCQDFKGLFYNCIEHLHEITEIHKIHLWYCHLKICWNSQSRIPLGDH